jgi:hypothetical protein
MAQEKLVQGVVRGPNSYFAADASLYAPGEIALVPAGEVGPGKKFADPKGEPVIGEALDTAQVATAQADRLDVTDFLKQGDPQIIAAIVSGTVDDHLGVIEQAVIAGKRARGDVKDAITARLAATHPVR